MLAYFARVTSYQQLSVPIYRALYTLKKCSSDPSTKSLPNPFIHTSHNSTSDMSFYTFRLLLVFVLTRLVAASSFCRCESKRGGTPIYGIQEICYTLGPQYCPTNCNIFYKNVCFLFKTPSSLYTADTSQCEYCQYVDPGVGGTSEYAKMINWCNAQPRETAGNTVNCYSFKNHRMPGLLEQGCKANDNDGVVNSKSNLINNDLTLPIHETLIYTLVSFRRTSQSYCIRYRPIQIQNRARRAKL